MENTKAIEVNKGPRGYRDDWKKELPKGLIRSIDKESKTRGKTARSYVSRKPPKL